MQALNTLPTIVFCFFSALAMCLYFFYRKKITQFKKREKTIISDHTLLPENDDLPPTASSGHKKEPPFLMCAH